MMKNFKLPTLRQIQLPIVVAGRWVLDIFRFNVLLLSYLFAKALRLLAQPAWVPAKLKHYLTIPFDHIYQEAELLSQKSEEKTVNRLILIELALRNMMAKKTRAYVTIGGMAVGIGAIVFLVSLGYGAQNLVISRVARLEELRQADVSPQTGSLVKLTDESLASFSDISGVEHVLPVIALVGRVTYNNSVSDMAAYGVVSEYLKQSAIKPSQGTIFESDSVSSVINEALAVQAEQQAEQVNPEPAPGKEYQPVAVVIAPGTWLRVRSAPETNAPVIGYTKQPSGSLVGTEVWGDPYVSETSQSHTAEDGTKYGKWVKAEFLLWEQQACTADTGECEDGKYVVLRDEAGTQTKQEGYVAEIAMEVTPQEVGDVLGDSIDLSALAELELDASASADKELQELAREIAGEVAPQTKSVELAPSAVKQAVVNRAMLAVMGLDETQAIGKSFEVRFVVTSDLLGSDTSKVESAPAQYTIVGVVPESATPFFYVPFVDLRGLGVNQYSQIKLVVGEKAQLASARSQVESMGYATSSVVDTVGQIDQLFATIRTILASLGLVALSVAALGMFNTLTVSLLERTREVGLMKAMGMRSYEIKDLFLAESMIMGLFGGFFGTIMGFLMGKVLGIILSGFSLFKGSGWIDISYIPAYFIATVFILSLLVGIVTGLYPAQRATKISALDALRYE